MVPWMIVVAGYLAVGLTLVFVGLARVCGAVSRRNWSGRHTINRGGS